MKISKNSWHYKLANASILGDHLYDEYEISHSLCLYFWQVVKAALQILVLIFTGVAAGSLIVTPAAGLLAWAVSGVYVEHYSIIIGAATALLVSMPILTIIWMGIMKLVRSDIQKPSLVSSYIQAKKDKLCPTIEFTK